MTTTHIWTEIKGSEVWELLQNGVEVYHEQKKDYKCFIAWDGLRKGYPNRGSFSAGNEYEYNVFYTLNEERK